MPSQHANPLLAWRPPAENGAWARAEAARRGVDLTVVMNEMLAAYREAVESGKPVTLPHLR